MKESRFQSLLIKEIQRRYPESVVLKIGQNGTGKQGFPDLLILFRDTWAALEVKKSRTAHRQPNQDRRIHSLNDMAFARFIYPENKQEVLDDLERAFERHPGRNTCDPLSK